MLGGGASLVVRRLRLDKGPALTMLALVGATCFLFAAMPRLFNRFADDGLRYTLSGAQLSERNPRLIEPGRVPAASGADPLANVTRRAARSQHEALPPALDELVTSRSFVVRSPSYGQTGGPMVPGIVRFPTLRVPASGIEAEVRVVKGRWPRPSAVRVRTVVETIPDRTYVARVPLLEVAVSETTAREMQVRVGQRLILDAGFSSPEALRLPRREQRPVAVEIVGVFAVRNPDSPFWFGDGTVNAPNVEVVPIELTKHVFAQALVSRAAYPELLAATKPFSLEYDYRYLLDDDRIDGSRVPALRGAADRLEERYAGAGPFDRRVELGLGPILDRFRSARAQAETLLAVAAIGLLACALANLGLLGALTYDRRGNETTVSRVRGASPTQTLAAQVAEAALIAVPAGVAGWVTAVLAIDARGNRLSAWLVTAIVVGTIVLLVASIAGVARRPLGSLAPAEVVPERPPRQRLAVEGLVAVAALLGVYLLRRRGFDSARGFDPYLAAVPVLLGLACGIAALRLHPLPVAGAARLARRTRGLAVHLGLSRAARQPDTTSLPVLVLVVALAIATFSAVMSSTLAAGQSRTGVRAIGADVRVDAAEDGSLPDALVTRLDAEGDVARAYVQDADLATGEEAKLVALDLPAYANVVAGTPAAVPLQGPLSKPTPIPSLVPAIVSTDWPIPLGNFQLPLPNQTVSFISVGDRRSLPGVALGTPFAVVSLTALRDAGGQSPVNRLYIAHVDLDAVRAAVRELAPGAAIRTSAEVASSVRASPLVDGVQRAFRWAVWLAALYAAVAIALLVLIAARSRARDLALVRTMGGAPRETLLLAAVELAPLVVLGIALGIGLGVAIPYLIEPGLDLRFFTGSSSSTIAIPATPLVVFAVGLLLFLVAAVLLVGLRTRRADLGRILRVGER